jgi:hypothetical protein
MFFPCLLLPVLMKTLMTVSAAACLLSALPASAQAVRQPPGLTPEEKAQIQLIERERQKEHDEAVEQALGEYQKALSAAKAPNERAAVIWKLGESEKDAKIVAVLARHLNDAEMVRKEAMAALGKYRCDPRAAETLARALQANAGSPETLVKNLDALAEVGHPSSSAFVMKFLDRRQDAQVIAAAARALGSLYNTGAIDALTAIWEDVEHDVKKEGRHRGMTAEQLRAAGGALKGALARLTGQSFGSPSEYRQWWIANRATYKLLPPPPPVLCRKHLNPVHIPGRPLPTGEIGCEMWTGIQGGSVSDLTGSSRFQMPPNRTLALKAFEAPDNAIVDCGTRIRGYLHPPVDGDYTFWLASDNGAELHLSPDALPDRKVLIAQCTLCGKRAWEKNIGDTAGRSKPIRLQVGRRYYIEALHKDGGGAAHLSVAWDMPGTGRQVIPGEYLSPFVPCPTPCRRSTNGTSWVGERSGPSTSMISPSNRILPRSRGSLTSGRPGKTGMRPETHSSRSTWPARRPSSSRTTRDRRPAPAGCRTSPTPANRLRVITGFRSGSGRGRIRRDGSSWAASSTRTKRGIPTFQRPTPSSSAPIVRPSRRPLRRPSPP